MTRNPNSLLLLLAAVMLSWTSPAMAQGGQLGHSLAKSGDIAVLFVGADAVYSNDVYYFAAVGDMTSATFLFNNHAAAAGAAADPDDSGLAIGSEAVFGICVNRAAEDPGADCANADDVFYTGPASRNSDNVAHAMVWTRTAYETEFGALDPTAFPPEYDFVIGFEDILGGGDRDYNDAIFAVRGTTVLPEPVTMTLLATGLAGMAGAGIRRRRQPE